MLQHVSQQRCCSLRRCGTIVAGAATLLHSATLRRCFSSRRGSAVVLLQPAATTESSALCNDGQWL